MIAYYIEKYPLRVETVEVICKMYRRSRFSHWLGERLENIFSKNPEKKNEFHVIAHVRGFILKGFELINIFRCFKRPCWLRILLPCIRGNCRNYDATCHSLWAIIGP